MQQVSSPPPGGIDNGDAGSDALSSSFAGLALAAASADAHAGPDDSSSALPTLTVVPMMGGGFTNPALAAGADKQQQQQQLEQAGASSGGRRLFFSQTSPDANEAAVRAVFGAHGAVEAVQLFSDAGGSSGCCGFVTMGSHDAARAALAALQQTAAAGAAPAALPGLSVSWALAEPCSSPTGTPDGASASSLGSLSSLAANAGRTVFFAKVPPTALASEVESLFGSFGKLAEVNVFRAWAGAKHSKGCGLITYAEREGAAAAIGQLHGKYLFPGSDCPMVVEWMDIKKQRPVAPSSSAEKPPLGCSSGAYKLLLGNVPGHVTEGDMAILLSQFGRVVHISLSPNTSNGALGLTCSGHIWFATKQSADALLERVKAEPLWLRDHRTAQDVALVVKKARRAGSSAHSSGSGLATSLTRLPVLGTSAIAMSSSSNSSSSNLLPSLQLAGGELGGMLAALQAGGRVAAAHQAIDTSMLSPDIIRLLPLQPMMGLGGGGGSGQLQHCSGPSAAPHGGYMAVDMCEAMLDMYDTTGMGMMAMPVHLQPAMAAQMASHVTLQPQHSLVGSACGLAGSSASMMQSCSGGHALPSAAVPFGSAREDLEGSFSVTRMHGGLSAGARTASGLQATAAQLLGLAPQQQVSQPAAAGLLWQQQGAAQPQQGAQVRMLPHGAGGVAQQVAQSAATAAAAGSGGFKSIMVPVEHYEVPLIAGHLAFLSASSGAQVTITCLPAGGLAVMVSGRADQVAAAQSLLTAARTRC